MRKKILSLNSDLLCSDIGDEYKPTENRQSSHPKRSLRFFFQSGKNVSQQEPKPLINHNSGNVTGICEVMNPFPSETDKVRKKEVVQPVMIQLAGLSQVCQILGLSSTTGELAESDLIKTIKKSAPFKNSTQFIMTHGWSSLTECLKELLQAKNAQLFTVGVKLADSVQSLSRWAVQEPLGFQTVCQLLKPSAKNNTTVKKVMTKLNPFYTQPAQKQIQLCSSQLQFITMGNTSWPQDF